MKRARRTLNALAAGTAVLAVAIDAAPAEEAGTDLLQGWGRLMHESCGSSGPRYGHCLAGLVSDTAVGHAAHLATREGKSAFGERFRVSGRMTLDPSGGLAGDLDAVVPLGPAGAATGEVGLETALFLQPGITSWRGDDGTRRKDVRVGMVYRFPVSESDMLGLSSVYQESLEHDHKRVVLGVDYAGRWGTGHVSQFVPATGWLPGRPGYEERARGGTELGARLALTSTLSADAAMGRWDADGGHAWNARLGVDLRLHPWISLGVGYETNHVGSGAPGDGPRVSMAFRIPLGRDGRGPSRPRWEGLGAARGAGTSPDPWAPVANAGRISVLERAAPNVVRTSAVRDATARADAVTQPEGVTAGFLQDDATTGSRIGVRVSVTEPLSADLRLVVRLVPGSGANPAVPGEDFVDELRDVTIRQGETSADAWFRLLHNAGMETARSLGVDVSLAGGA